MTQSTGTMNPPAVVLRRVSTDEQGKSGHGLDAQLHTCEQAIADKGWEHIAVFTEVVSGFSKPLAKRQAALDAIELCRQESGILVVSKGDRLSRRMMERLETIERSQKEGWFVFMCDLPEADPTTASGWMMQAMFAMLAEYERRIISERTKDALHALIRSGGSVGRPPEVSNAARAAATFMFEQCDMNWTEIARALDADGYTPPRGTKWNRNTVRHMVLGIPWGSVTRRIQAEQQALDPPDGEA